MSQSMFNGYVHDVRNKKLLPISIKIPTSSACDFIVTLDNAHFKVHIRLLTFDRFLTHSVQIKASPRLQPSLAHKTTQKRRKSRLAPFLPQFTAKIAYGTATIPDPTMNAQKSRMSPYL